MTYVDVDRRAERCFGDTEGVRQIVADNQTGDGQTDGGVRSLKSEFRFIPADYQDDLGLQFGLEDQSFDLLVSLYAGFISEH